MLDDAADQIPLVGRELPVAAEQVQFVLGRIGDEGLLNNAGLAGRSLLDAVT